CSALILIALKVARNARRAVIVSAPRKRLSKWRSVSSAWTWTVPSHSVLHWPQRQETVTQATPELLELSQEILNPAPDQAPLVLADSEHYTTELLDHVHLETPFELLVPMPPQNSPKL